MLIISRSIASVAGILALMTLTAARSDDVKLIDGRSPTPACLVKFMPVKGDNKFTLAVRNNGPGFNKVTLKVKVDD
jgi:hypothetical protein